MDNVRNTVDKSRRMFQVFLVMMALSATSISVWAQKNSSSTISATIMLNEAAKVGTTQLAAGEYKVIADGKQAKFQQGKNVVAQVPCTLMDLSFTPKVTQVSHDDSGRISEIQITGKTKAIEFSY